MCCLRRRLRVPALHAPPPATPSAGPSPHPSTQTQLLPPRLTHLRTRSWAWEGMSRRPSLRVSQLQHDILHIVSKIFLEVDHRCFFVLFYFYFYTYDVCFQGPRRNLRNDLLIAADSITSTMSSLVKELNSGNNA